MAERLAVGGAVRLVSGYRGVRDDAGALPVRAGDRVDRARERYRDVHRRADRERPGGVGAAAGRLADHLRAAQRLQRVGEVLRAGEGAAAGEHVHRAVQVPAARQVGLRPELPGLPSVSVEDVVQVHGLLREEVAAPEPHAGHGSAAVAPQVDDQRVGPADQLHRRGDGGAGVLRHRYPAQVKVADVAVQALHAVDAEVVQPSPLAHLQPPRLMVEWLIVRALRPVPAVRAARTAGRLGRAGPGPGPPPGRGRRRAAPLGACRR